MKNNIIKVVLFDDNPEVRSSITELLNINENIKLCGVYSNALGIDKIVGDLNPDIVLLDIQMTKLDGLSALKIVKSKHPAAGVIMFTVFEDPEIIFKAICSGASGYILKSAKPDVIIESIQNVFNGGASLTPSVAKKILNSFITSEVQPEYGLTGREKDVLSELIKGKSQKLIAESLFISTDTVKTHIRNIYEKLNVSSSTEAVAKAINKKIV